MGRGCVPVLPPPRARTKGTAPEAVVHEGWHEAPEPSVGEAREEDAHVHRREAAGGGGQEDELWGGGKRRGHVVGPTPPPFLPPLLLACATAMRPRSSAKKAGRCRRALSVSDATPPTMRPAQLAMDVSVTSRSPVDCPHVFTPHAPTHWSCGEWRGRERGVPGWTLPAAALQQRPPTRTHSRTAPASRRC